MSYSVPNIILWAKMSQALAAVGEAKKKAVIGGSQEWSLDMQLYNARKDLEYEYELDPASSNLFQLGNYVLALCGTYLFQAQAAIGGGGTVTPMNPSINPSVIEFIVSASSIIPTGGTTVDLSSYGYIGYNVLLVRGHITQSTINDGGTYYSWNSTTAVLTLISGAAQADELLQIYPTL